MPNKMAILFKPDFLTIPLILIQDKDIRPLDREVYAIVYWAVRLKNEKCTMSNTTIADCLGASPSGVANALVRLNNKHYIKTIYKDDNKKERLEIIPLIFFARAGKPYSNEYTWFTQMSKGVYSNEEQNKNINKNTIYTQVLTRWNSYKIINHRELTKLMEGKINSKLENYSLEEILIGINNYAKILADPNCYFKYRWTLVDFLQRGFEKFFDYQTAKTNFSKKSPQDMEVVGSGYMNYKDYVKKHGIIK